MLLHSYRNMPHIYTVACSCADLTADSLTVSQLKHWAMDGMARHMPVCEVWQTLPLDCTERWLTCKVCRLTTNGLFAMAKMLRSFLTLSTMFFRIKSFFRMTCIAGSHTSPYNICKVAQADHHQISSRAQTSIAPTECHASRPDRRKCRGSTVS